VNYEELLYEKNGNVLTITINIPSRLNSLGEVGWQELADAFNAADGDGEIGVIVLTGAGDRAFCAGGYLAELADFDAERSRRMYRTSSRAFHAIRKARQPVIAAVNGYAIGGGNEIVIACDLAVASDTARYGQVGAKVGSVPIFGATNLHALNIGEKRAKEMTFLCRQFSAHEAAELGWVNKVVPHDDLLREVHVWCEELLDKSPVYLELAKASSNTWWDMMQSAYTHGEQLLMRTAGSEQNLEGARAFMEKRKPDFRRFRKSTKG
jgi:enoyl-CoA hydratase/carnithine racemase